MMQAHVRIRAHKPYILPGTAALLGTLLADALVLEDASPCVRRGMQALSVPSTVALLALVQA